jgi:(S)-ureidoglycine aminohydrolase
MKIALVVIGLFFSAISFAQLQPLVSKVYSYKNAPTVSSKKAAIKTIFNGSGAILLNDNIKVVALIAGKKMNYEKENSNELFIIVKEGSLSITLNDKLTELGRGSIVCVMPGDKLLISNNSKSIAYYYAMDYVSIAAPNAERGAKAGGSFIVNWNDIAFKEHDRGGVRNFFIRPTTMLNKFDIHVTTMNPGKISHPPHTHTNEEIILMLDGSGEMQIGNEHQACQAGDVVFLNSMVLHNFSNNSSKPATYYAIQWN